MACTANKTPLFRSVIARGYSASAQVSPSSSPCSDKIHTTVLPNKLVVSSIESNSPISRISILFRAGSRNECYETLGASHMLRVAAGLTTKNATTFGITRNIQQVGGNLSITSDREIVSYNVELTRDNLETGLKYLQNTATNQLFKPWELEDSLPRLKGDVARIPDQVRAIELLHKAAYRTGLGNSIYCPDFHVGKLSSETMQHYFSSNFTTNRSAVVGVGVDHNLLVGYAQSLDLESGAGNDVASKYEGLGEIRFDKAGSMAHVAIATEGAGLNNLTEAVAFAVLQYAAGVSSSVKRGESQGPLSKVVAKALGDKPFAVNAFNTSYTDNGLFGFVISANGSCIGKAIEAGVKAIKSGSISSDDVARGKAQLKAAILFDLEHGCRLIEDMGAQALLLGQVQNVTSLLAAVDGITATDVSAAARKASTGKLSIGAVGNLVNVPYVNQLN